MTKAKALHILKRALILSVAFVFLLGIVLALRPLPSLQPTLALQSSSEDPAVVLPWPNYGQAAIGALGYGVLDTHGAQKPAPIASVSKVMTAYAVLKQKPLKLNQQGPLITITDEDVTSYNDYYLKGGSIAKVEVGEKISEYQALQALLLPSANNFADTLANWAFGSMDQYIVYANNLTKSLGLKDTKISDASGFSAQTKSTARDLVSLGEEALKHPVIAQIIAQEQANIPVAGTIRNVNWLLNMDNVNGIKTGDTDAAGGCYLFSSKRKIGSKEVTVIGSIVGAPNLNQAISDARPLLQASDKGFGVTDFVKAGQMIGYYQTPWGSRVEAVAKTALSMFDWRGAGSQAQTKLYPQKARAKAGSVVGQVSVASGRHKVTSPVVLKANIASPSWRWRIFDR